MLRTPPDFLSALIGKAIWHVNAGGATWPTFSLAVGGVVARRVPLRNPSVSEVFRTHTGELNLFVWSGWRIENAGAVVASSTPLAPALPRLLELDGLSFEDVQCVAPAWDISAQLSNGVVLRAFYDRASPTNATDTSWELTTTGTALSVGPGCTFQIDD